MATKTKKTVSMPAETGKADADHIKPCVDTFVSDYLKLVEKHGLTIQFDLVTRNYFIGECKDVFASKPEKLENIIKKEKRRLLQRKL